MIYTTQHNKRLAQGDILKNLPQITSNEIDFTELITNTGQPTLRINPKFVMGIILTQSCDIRPEYPILVAEIYTSNSKLNSTLWKRANDFWKILRQEHRFHYLPPDSTIHELKEPHFVNMTNIFSLPYELLIKNIDNYFVARLNEPAQYLLKEKIIHFFTRPAFDDILYLTDNEIKAILDNEKNSKIKITRDEMKQLFNMTGRQYNEQLFDDTGKN